MQTVGVVSPALWVGAADPEEGAEWWSAPSEPPPSWDCLTTSWRWLKDDSENIRCLLVYVTCCWHLLIVSPLNGNLVREIVGKLLRESGWHAMYKCCIHLEDPCGLGSSWRKMHPHQNTDINGVFCFRAISGLCHSCKRFPWKSYWNVETNASWTRGIYMKSLKEIRRT